MNGHVSISCVGDIALSDHPLLYGAGVRSSLNNGSELFEDVRSLFQEANVVLGNLECPLIKVDEKADLKDKTFCGDIWFSSVLKSAGFTVLNIANNHIMQHGPTGYSSTISALEGEGIASIGGGKGFTNTYYVYEANEIKIAFVGYSSVKERNNFKPLYFHDSEGELLALVKALKKKVDRIVISVHWGIEDINRPDYKVIMLARKLCDCGADIILGHHPHVVQAIEKYNGSLIFYSLGNFVFDCIWSDKYKQSMIVEIQISKDDCAYRLHPVKIKSDYKIELIKGKEKEQFLDYIESISSREYYQTKNTIEDISRFNSDVIKEEKKLQFYKMLYLIKRIHRMRFDTVKYLISKMM